MISFAKSNSCKRHFLLKALSLSQDEKDMPVCENCDVCTKDASNVKSEIEITCNYIKMRKIKKEELIEAIANMGEYWNLQYSKKLISYMEEKNIIIKDRLFWRGKLKLNKRHL